MQSLLNLHFVGKAFCFSAIAFQLVATHDAKSAASVAQSSQAVRYRSVSCLLSRLCDGAGRGESNPQGSKYRRILSSTAGSEPLGKSSNLLCFSTGYQTYRLHRYDPISNVLTMELLQPYYSMRHETREAKPNTQHNQCPGGSFTR